MKKEFDVVGIGSPLLDIIIEVGEDVLQENNLKKGGMHLVDGVQSRRILERLEKYAKTHASGGSAANTVSGVCALGGKGSFLGVVGNDDSGNEYEIEMSSGGAHPNLLRYEGEQTGHAITLVTPDGERTFVTHSGAAQHFKKEHVSEEIIENSKILHVEGYQLENSDTREAVVFAMEIAKNNETIVSLDLSDPGIILGNKDVIVDIVKKYVDIVFVNEDEAFAFTGKKEDEALHEIYELCDVAVVKLGGRGSLIKADGKVYFVEPESVDVVNTNGAGDMYAAGFLHGLAHGRDVESAGKVASRAAALVVASPGARIHDSHKEKLEDILKIYN